MRISKEFKAEIAHKLSSSWTEKCQHIHGHSYRFVLELLSSELNDEGVVVDFGKVAADVKAKIIDDWDHSFFIHELDPLLSHESFTWAMKSSDQRLRICNFNPTAENMAKFLYTQIFKLIALSGDPEYKKVKVAKVTVWETATSSAEAELFDFSLDQESWLNLNIIYQGKKL